MRILPHFQIACFLIAICGIPQSAAAQPMDSFRVAQVVTPQLKGPAPASGPRTLRQVNPPQQPAAPDKKQAVPQLRATSTLASLEEENKALKDRATKQDLIILSLTSKLDQAEKAGALLAVRVKQLDDQVQAMTKPGGALVRAFCDGQFVSRNTAGASNNCAGRGYACEPVSGTCYARCSKTDQCAKGWVCDPTVSACIVAR
jgi:hypothetical protein